MKYGVYVEWSYLEPQYENCSIGIVSKEQEQYDGENMIGHAGMEGYHFDIYSSLEKAIVNSGFNPEHIEFDENINRKNIDKVLNKYVWTYETGYKKKEKI